jgi:hypothetical protein
MEENDPAVNDTVNSNQPIRTNMFPKIQAAFFISALVFSTTACFGIKTSDRQYELENYHGYYPCSDCHSDQETNSNPRFLVEEHYEPLEWEDSLGVTRYMVFGEMVSFADLMGAGSARSRNAENLLKIGNNLNVESYMDENGFAPEDSIWTLTHGGANLWCLDCHSADNRDNLVKMNGEILSFNQSQELCGQCHGPILIDWEKGIHGRTNGYWNRDMDKEGISTRQLCVECHMPHAPSFKSMMPMSAPVPRIENIPANVQPHHDSHRGERDDMGPHKWVKTDDGKNNNQHSNH